MTFYPSITLTGSLRAGTPYRRLLVSMGDHYPSVTLSKSFGVGKPYSRVPPKSYTPAVTMMTVFSVGVPYFKTSKFYFPGQYLGTGVFPLIPGEQSVTIGGKTYPSQTMATGTATDFELYFSSVALGDTVLAVSRSSQNGTPLGAVWNFNYLGDLIGVIEFQKDLTNTYLQWRAWPGIELFWDGAAIHIRGIPTRIQGGYLQIAMRDSVTNRYTDAGPDNDSKTYVVLFRDSNGNTVSKTVRVRGYKMTFQATPMFGQVPLNVSFSPRWVVKP